MELYESSIAEKNEEIEKLIKDLEEVKRQLATEKMNEPQMVKSISQIERE